MDRTSSAAFTVSSRFDIRRRRPSGADSGICAFDPCRQPHRTLITASTSGSQPRLGFLCAGSKSRVEGSDHASVSFLTPFYLLWAGFGFILGREELS
jgi:hypothetical protein